MIPKILHLYWGRNKPLSYLRYLTATSFVKHNPDWKIMVGYPKETVNADYKWVEQNRGSAGDDWFDKLQEIDNVEMVEHSFSEYPYVKTEIHRSDIYRWETVIKHGGVWSDFDILFTESMPDIESHDTLLIMYWRCAYLIGFFAANKGNNILNNILQTAKINLQSDKVGSGGRKLRERYQVAGQISVTACMTKGRLPKEVIHWPLHIVYPIYPPDKVLMTSMDYSKTKGCNFGKGCIGLHWSGGNPMTNEIEKLVSPDFVYGTSAFHRLIKSVI